MAIEQVRSLRVSVLALRFGGGGASSGMRTDDDRRENDNDNRRDTADDAERSRTRADDEQNRRTRVEPNAADIQAALYDEDYSANSSPTAVARQVAAELRDRGFDVSASGGKLKVGDKIFTVYLRGNGEWAVRRS